VILDHVLVRLMICGYGLLTLFTIIFNFFRYSIFF